MHDHFDPDAEPFPLMIVDREIADRFVAAMSDGVARDLTCAEAAAIGSLMYELGAVYEAADLMADHTDAHGCIPA